MVVMVEVITYYYIYVLRYNCAKENQTASEI